MKWVAQTFALVCTDLYVKLNPFSSLNNLYNVESRFSVIGRLFNIIVVSPTLLYILAFFVLKAAAFAGDDDEDNSCTLSLVWSRHVRYGTSEMCDSSWIFRLHRFLRRVLAIHCHVGNDAVDCGGHHRRLSCN